MKRNERKNTSWEPGANWYDQIVGEDGHYYHQEVIFPKLLPLLNLQSNQSLLDLACGQGVLERALPKDIQYTGIDLSPQLLKKAKHQRKNPFSEFHLHDICKPFKLDKKFDKATILLAFQNLSDPIPFFENVIHHLKDGGELCMVINHPCFRIPRQTHWEIDEAKKMQYRRINRYMTPLSIPIKVHPSQKGSQTLTSYHRSLSEISNLLYSSNFSIEKIEEWCSNKQSTGKTARMENTARKEFPLFLTLLARKRP